jgi:hypothetical protein
VVSQLAPTCASDYFIHKTKPQLEQALSTLRNDRRRLLESRGPLPTKRPMNVLNGSVHACNRKRLSTTPVYAAKRELLRRKEHQRSSYFGIRFKKLMLSCRNACHRQLSIARSIVRSLDRELSMTSHDSHLPQARVVDDSRLGGRGSPLSMSPTPITSSLNGQLEVVDDSQLRDQRPQSIVV